MFSQFNKYTMPQLPENLFISNHPQYISTGNGLA